MSSVSGDQLRADVAIRAAALQLGYWLGWASIAVVLASLAFDMGAKHRWLLVALTLAASAGNTAAMLIPWREWLSSRRGRLLLDAWSAGLIAFVALLVTSAGSSYTLLLFLVVPFIAVVQAGWRRRVWLAVTAGTCALVAALVPLSAGATAVRLMLVGVAAAVAVLTARAIRLQTVRSREANHRIKNDLQTAADLLLLSRPDGVDGEAFDEAANRIRSIATVHRLLTEADDRIDAGVLLRTITADLPVPVDVAAEPLALDPKTAQTLGVVANELVTNAFRHGTPPIAIRLTHDHETRLVVEDRGAGAGDAGTGLGLALVRRLVEDGLGGRFELRAAAGAGTRAEVVFP